MFADMPRYLLDQKMTTRKEVQLVLSPLAMALAEIPPLHGRPAWQRGAVRIVAVMLVLSCPLIPNVIEYLNDPY